MKALLLAAGKGKRLGPLGEVLPKALVPVLTVPIIEYGLAGLEEAGAKEVVANAHHLAPKLLSWAQVYKGPLSPEIVHEETLLGTGGALRNVREQFERGRFLIANADILHGVDLRKTLAAHEKQKSLATLVLRSTGWEKTGGFWVKEGGLIGGYLPPGQRPPSGGRAGLFTGLHVLEPEILKSLPGEKVFCIVQKLYRPLLEKNAPLAGHFDDEARWEDLGTPARYLAGNFELLASLPAGNALAQRARRLLETHGVRLEGNVALGKNARLPAGGAGEPCILGKEAQAAEGARLERVIAWEGARIPAGTWKDVVFYRGEEFVSANSPA